MCQIWQLLFQFLIPDLKDNFDRRFILHNFVFSEREKDDIDNIDNVDNEGDDDDALVDFKFLRLLLSSSQATVFYFIE